MLAGMDGLDQNLFGMQCEEPPYDMAVGPGMASGNRRFGALLERIREHADLSRAEVAAALGVSAEYLRLIELGRRTPALGQMRSFLDAYHADGEVGRLQPGGDRPDLILLDPSDDEPVLVEFTSRIREARRTTISSSRRAIDAQESDPSRQAREGLSTSRVADLGFVVSLLVRADDSTIRRVRELLQDELGDDVARHHTGQ
ncbi:hypothetical protein ASH00_14640 [Arthrobacter sp. Soil782]|uniref:helix-turn-helix domain-containing protein n=1 Tax=Arthrobacter sp. Soil782 TaxID=1736410 RepID=UPI0006FC1378|nr:hypothetical protein ASH00_14640 [Arthrobacter sp. Soil782]